MPRNVFLAAASTTSRLILQAFEAYSFMHALRSPTPYSVVDTLIPIMNPSNALHPSLHSRLGQQRHVKLKWRNSEKYHEKQARLLKLSLTVRHRTAPPYTAAGPEASQCPPSEQVVSCTTMPDRCERHDSMGLVLTTHLHSAAQRRICRRVTSGLRYSHLQLCCQDGRVTTALP